MILEYICGHSHKVLQIFPIPILDSHWGIDTERLGEFYFFFFLLIAIYTCVPTYMCMLHTVGAASLLPPQRVYRMNSVVIFPWQEPLPTETLAGP